MTGPAGGGGGTQPDQYAPFGQVGEGFSAYSQKTWAEWLAELKSPLSAVLGPLADLCTLIDTLPIVKSLMTLGASFDQGNTANILHGLQQFTNELTQLVCVVVSGADTDAQAILDAANAINNAAQANPFYTTILGIGQAVAGASGNYVVDLINGINYWLGDLIHFLGSPGGLGTGIITGVIPAVSIAGLDATKIVSGQFPQNMIIGLEAALAGVGDVTQVQTDLQTVIDGIYQAMFGGTSTGNLPSSVKTALLNIPGVNVVSPLLASVIPGLDATKIISGVFNQAQIPALTGTWGKTIAASLVSGALVNATLAAAALTAGAIPAGVTIAGSALTSAISAANVPALPAGWGKTVDGALIAGNVLSTAVIPPITPPMTTGLALIDDVTNAIQATSIVGNTVAQMQYALANMPHVNVQPLVGTAATDLGGSLQAHIDAGVQAITGSTAGGNPLSLFQTAFGQFTDHVGVVTVNQPYVPPASVTAVSHANNSYIQQQSINYEIAHAVDPTCNGPFDLATIALAALSTVTVAQGTAVQCFDHIPFGGIKQSIRWLGNPSSGASFTDFRVNIYQLDTTTGIETLVYASENIAAAVSASGTPVWKAYNIPSGAVQTLSLGTSVTPPTGPGFPYTFPFPLVAARSFTLTFSGQTTTAIPYPPTTVSIQNALAALSNIGTGKVLVADNGGGDFFITFAGTMAAITHPLITIDSTLLPNTTPTVADFIVATQGSMFAAEIVVVGTGNYNIVGITNNLPVHTTAIPARFGATRAVGSLGFTYAAATPWIGLASTTSISAPDTPPLYVPPTFNPVLLGWGSSTVVQNPAVTYPLANYFDVIIFGGGGGGAAGSNLSGSVGGYAAPHAVWSGVPRALIGTAGLTINVGGGGYGGGSTGAPGGNGGGSSVVIPGWTTLSVGGGAGNSGASSSFYGGPGQNESSATWSDAYYNPQGLAGGAGGQSPQAAGALPGGGGAGGSATLVGANIYGGAGGGGAVYIYCYQ